MKSALLICTCLICAICYGQQTEYSAINDKGNAHQNQVTPPTEKRSLVIVENEIRSIESKMNIVKADPIQLEEAKQSGWYDQFSTKLEILKREKQFYLELEKNGGIIKTYSKEEFNSLPETKQKIILSNPDKYKVEK